MYDPTKPIQVFLSSTVHDLRDARGAIKYVLEEVLKIRVLASEYGDFPVSVNEHSYIACLEQVRCSDLMILLIDRRYGGTTNSPDERISITRREFREARSAGIPVWTFVRRSLDEERNDFKRSLYEKRQEAPEVTAEEHFVTFRQHRAACAQRVDVYEFIDEVTSQDISNWRFNDFDDVGDVISTICNQFDQLAIHLKLDSLLAPVRKESLIIPTAVIRLLDQEGRFAEANRHIVGLSDMIARGGIASVGSLLELRRLKRSLIDQLVETEVNNISGLVDGGPTSRFYAVDNSMEAVSPDVWISNQAFRRILAASSSASQRSKRRLHYTRFIAVSDPRGYLASGSGERALFEICEFHLKNGIQLGFFSVVGTNVSVHDRLLNFYVLPREFLNVVDMLSGIVVEFYYPHDRLIVDQFSAQCDQFQRRCNKNDHAFFVSHKMSRTDLLLAVANLAVPSH